MKASIRLAYMESLARVVLSKRLIDLQQAYKEAVAKGFVNNRMEYEYNRRRRQLESQQ